VINVDKNEYGPHHIFETVKIGDRGQIVIPKDVREMLSIVPGDTLIIMGDATKGIGIFKAERMRTMAQGMLDGLKKIEDATKKKEKK